MTQPPLANTVVSISAAEPGSLPPELAGKAAALADNLGALGSVAVAFSGGVDSALVMAVASVMPAEGPSLGVAPSGTCTWMSTLR